MTHNKIWLKYSDNTHYTVCVHEPVDTYDFVEYEISQDQHRSDQGIYG